MIFKYLVKFELSGTDDFTKFGFMLTQLLDLVRGSIFNSILAGIFVFFATGIYLHKVLHIFIKLYLTKFQLDISVVILYKNDLRICCCRNDGENIRIKYRILFIWCSLKIKTFVPLITTKILSFIHPRHVQFHLCTTWLFSDVLAINWFQ